MVTTLGRRYSGAERAAILLLALGEERGRPVWERLEDEEIRKISAAMSHLGQVEATQVETLVSDFVQEMGSVAINGDLASTRELLLRLLPSERVDQIMEEVGNSGDSGMWNRLSNTHEAVLANYVRNEMPQTAALILGRLEVNQAARVLRILPRDFAVEVIDRMLTTGTVPRAVMEKVEDTLRSDFMAYAAKGVSGDAMKKVVTMFSQMDRETEIGLMSGLERVNPEVVPRIRRLMFTFDDLTKLDPSSLQLVISKTDRTVLARALKGTPDYLRQLFTSRMSQRAASMLEEEIASMRPLRLSEVDQAQVTMLAIAKQLEEAGMIVIPKGNPEDELVY